VTKAGNHAGNDLTITVLTDQNMRPGSAIPNWNHELLGMPEGEDNVASAPVEGVNRFMTTRLPTHGRRDGPNQRSADWR
jgi:hypothetical protein